MSRCAPVGELCVVSCRVCDACQVTYWEYPLAAVYIDRVETYLLVIIGQGNVCEFFSSNVVFLLLLRLCGPIGMLS